MSVWGTHNITLCEQHVGKPLLFLNVAAKYTGELSLNFWADRLIVPDCKCERVETLKKTAAEAGFAVDRELLTSQSGSTWDPDRADDVLKQEALASCCACLHLASDDPSVSLPQILQVNGMRLEEPEPGESVVERTDQRVFFTTTARDLGANTRAAGVPYFWWLEKVCFWRS